MIVLKPSSMTDATLAREAATLRVADDRVAAGEGPRPPGEQQLSRAGGPPSGRDALRDPPGLLTGGR